MKISYRKIYVLCPYGLVTGGSDALHQLVYYINQVKNQTAVLIYCDRKEKNLTIPECYRDYIDSYKTIDEIPDEKDIAVIVPETLWFHLKDYHHVRKYIWWLSVDKNTEQTAGNKLLQILKKLCSIKTWRRLFSGYYSKDKIKDFGKNTPYDFNDEDKGIIHLCASHYALDYVRHHSENGSYLMIEPISMYYLKAGCYQNKDGRKKQVLYNPVKSGEFVKLLIRKRRDLVFLPLQGYQQDQLLDLYRHSMLYVDFGPFPGAERMPKEACYNGCLIITGKAGASAYHADVAIPDEDKFPADKENIDSILDRIDAMLNHTDEFTNRDEEYVNMISDLEKNFIKAIEEIL